MRSDLRDDSWRPIPGRRVICRVVGCREASADDVLQLCKRHRRLQKAVAKETRRLAWRVKLKCAELPQASGPLPEVEGWEGKGLCRHHPELDWFAEDKTGQALAAAVCERCPVALECLQAGLWSPFGIWGGFTARDRRQALREPEERTA